MANKTKFLSDQEKHNYMLLSRLIQDCEYYLGNGNMCKKHLWAGNEIDQIEKMRELYNGFCIKPIWCTINDINYYESKMVIK